MSGDDDNSGKVETLKPGKSLIETAFNKLSEQKKKDKKSQIDKQVVVASNAYDVFRTEMQKLADMEAEYKAIDDDKTTLVDLGLA